MKRFLHLAALAILAAAAAPDLKSATLTPSQFRKFRGTYAGNVSGIAGNNLSGSRPVAFATVIVVAGKRSEFLKPLISDLHAAPAHRIVWRIPTGTARRARIVGIYTGTFSSVPGGVTTGFVKGTRTLVFSDRGTGQNFRYAASLKDSLREDGFSGQDLSGILLRKR